jgi:hypothetical protein
VSAPAAAAGAVAVVTSEGLQVLDASTGDLRWGVDEAPVGIYPYTPALVGADAAAVHNCLATLASNSLCLYSREAPPPVTAGAASAADAGGDASASSTSGSSAAQAGLPALVMLLCAALPALL